MPAHILIIDDEDAFREDFATLLRRKGYRCHTAGTAEAGLRTAVEELPDIVLCDIVLPDRSGVDLLPDLAASCPGLFVIMITAYGNLDTAVAAFQMGAVDYVLKPLRLPEVIQKIERLMSQRRRNHEIRRLRRRHQGEHAESGIVGDSEAMAEVQELVRKVAPTRSTVLITGESGTGKEVVARELHELSDAREEPFVAINCAGIPENLLESELFGHRRGAFTGATHDRTGFLEMAGKGTIFLDEISEMAVTLQSKLLRVVEQREYYPVGASEVSPLQARIVASSNRDIKASVENGMFRQDLYYRLAVFEIQLPPLRERRADIPALAAHFVKLLATDLAKPQQGLVNEVVRALMSYDWPGNVRELRNVIERALILGDGGHVTLAELPHRIGGVAASQVAVLTDNLRESLRSYERDHIRRVVLECKGNKEKASRRMGINPSTLYRKLAEFELGN